MRMLSKVKLNWSSAGSFWFWAAVLLVLPNCTLDTSGIAVPSNVNRGTGPRTSTIFCDIERPAGRHCASPTEIFAGGIRLTGGAVALVAGQTSDSAMDYSPEALSRCAGGPEVVTFHGAFPEGTPVCLDCAVIGPGPAPHASNAAVCTAHCLDLFATGDGNVPPSAEALAFCTPARAHLSTNFPTTGCFAGACTTSGTLNPDFDDPRRIPEPVEWVNLVGVSAAGGTLTRTAANTGAFDAGATSAQVIIRGDGYVEFTATETDRIRIAGLSSGLTPLGGITFNDIGFGIELYNTGEIFVFESGTAVSTFGAYTAGQKFRVKLEDRFDGTATVSYARLTGPCVDGSPCSETVFFTSTNTATYPVRVDAMFYELGATVTEARFVRVR